MRRALLIFFAFAGACLAGIDYAGRFQSLKDKGSSKDAEALLDEWRQNAPGDPDAWISSANYYFNKSSTIDISTKPAGVGDLVVADQKTGKAVGSLSSARDPRLAKKSAGFLEEAVKRFPNRLDIWCGLSYTLQEIGDPDGELKVLKECVAYTIKHPDQLRWRKGLALPSPPGTFVPEQIHDYATYYYEKNTVIDNERAFKIAELAATNYPAHPFALNDLAALSSRKNDFLGTRGYLEKAHRVAPTDTLVLLNLADVCVTLKDIKSARAYYQSIIALKPNADDLAAAKQGLQQIGDH
jgi:tetratricopeptide (TPR) repeat protein